MASCIPTPQPQHLRSFPHTPAASHFPITAPQCNSPNTSRGTPLAQVALLVGPFASCRDESCVSAPCCCSRTANVPSLGQRDIPSPETLMPAKESQRQGRTAGPSRSYSGPSSSTSYPVQTTHGAVVTPWRCCPKGSAPHELLHAPRSSHCPHRCLHRQSRQGSSHLAISPTLLRLL